MRKKRESYAEFSKRALALYNELLRQSATEWREKYWLPLTEEQRNKLSREAALNLDGVLAPSILNMRKFYPTDDDVNKTVEQGKPDEKSE